MRRLSRPGRVVGFVALVVGLAVPSVVAQPPSSLEGVLQLQLIGQELETRVPIGPPVTYRESVIARTVTRQVVTDIEADGTINYVMPMMYVPFLPKKEFMLSQLSDAIPAGSLVRVSEINLGRKNVVIGVTEQRRGVPSTIRLRLGKKYEERVSASEVLRLLSQVLVLPRYEQVGELERRHTGLQSSIRAAEQEHTAPGQNNEQKLASGRKLEGLLEEALANRREFGDLGNDTSAEQQTYTQKLSTLAPQLAALGEAAGQDRLSGIEGELAEIAAEEGSIAGELASAKPGSSGELERLRRRLSSWEGLIARRGELHGELTSLGSEVTAVEQDRAAQSAKGLRDARNRLQSADRGVQIGDAVGRLQRLHDQAPQLKADLMASQAVSGDLDQVESGMSKFRKSIDERRRLVKQLDALGRKVSDPVLLRIEDDQAELGRFQTVLNTERGSAEVRELDRAYQPMETEFLEIVDTYTLAFGTDKQLTEARRLLAQLRKMAQNRKSASELGSAQAGSELRTLEGQIADLQKRNPRLR